MSLAIPDQRQFTLRGPGLLLLASGIALVVLALSRWDPRAH